MNNIINLYKTKNINKVINEIIKFEHIITYNSFYFIFKYYLKLNINEFIFNLSKIKKVIYKIVSIEINNKSKKEYNELLNIIQLYKYMSSNKFEKDIDYHIHKIYARNLYKSLNNINNKSLNLLIKNTLIKDCSNLLLDELITKKSLIDNIFLINPDIYNNTIYALLYNKRCFLINKYINICNTLNINPYERKKYYIENIIETNINYFY